MCIMLLLKNFGLHNNTVMNFCSYKNGQTVFLACISPGASISNCRKLHWKMRQLLLVFLVKFYLYRLSIEVMLSIWGFVPFFVHFCPMRIAPLFALLILLASGTMVHAQQQPLARKEDSLAALLKQQPHDTVKLKILQALSNLYQDVQPQKALPWILQAKDIATKTGNDDKLLVFSTQEMRCKGRLAQYAEAMQVAEQAAPLLKSKNVQPRNTAGFHLQKGQVLYKMAAYDKCAAELNLAADIARQHQLADVEVKVLINLTLVQEALEKYPEMRVQFFRALALAEKAGLADDAANIKINLALLESRLNNYGKAIEYLNDVLPYYQQQHNDMAAGLCYANLAYGYLQVKEYPKALLHAQQSLVIRTRLGDQNGLAKLHIIMGQVHMETGRYDSARSHLDSGIALATKLALPQHLKDGYKALAQLYERTKQYQSAYQSLQHYNDWKDTVFQQDKQKQLIQQLNLYKAKYVDSLVQKKDTVIGKQQTTISYLWVALSILLVAALLVGYWMFRKKKEQVSALAQQNGAAENGTIGRQQEEIEHLNRELRMLQASLKEQTSDDLVKLRKLVVESNLQTEGYWNEFLLLFSKVYPNFFEQLKTDYPQLTQNELRICSLMKLNLSLLEIANLLNITTESGRKARYRIYKKMDLNSDKELAERILLF